MTGDYTEDFSDIDPLDLYGRYFGRCGMCNRWTSTNNKYATLVCTPCKECPDGAIVIEVDITSGTS